MGVAARAKPDGYTLLLTSSVLVVNPLLYRSVPFDPAKDFTPISLLATSPNLMLAKPDVAGSMVEFIAKAKARPGQLNYSTPGIGTKGHFATELLKLRAGIDVVHVPYASGGQVVQSLLTDTTQLGSTALPAGEPLVRAGTLTGARGQRQHALADLARRADHAGARLFGFRRGDFHSLAGACRHAAGGGERADRCGRQAVERPGRDREGRARRLCLDRRRS
jgi:Tripartite tricarboxylate transporter family receptor